MIRAIILAAAIAGGLVSAVSADDLGDADPLERSAAAGQPEITRASHAPFRITITPMAAEPVEPDLPVGTRPMARPEFLMTPRPPRTLKNASELECIAVAIYHEARGESDFGQRAVASVILQRAAVPHRWGDSACTVVVPVQFSFMNEDGSYASIDDMEAWTKALSFAAEVLEHGPMPALRGADHYHTVNVDPYWAPTMVRVRQIETHIFYVDPRSTVSS